MTILKNRFQIPIYPRSTPSLLCFALLLLGCRKHDHSTDSPAHEHGETADHAHEPKTAQITVWSRGFEIFAEHTPPVVGQPVRFITHVTDISTGEARKSGTVKFQMEQGSASFEQAVSAPARPGIYIPEITFPKEGEWILNLFLAGETNTTVQLGTIAVFPDAHSAAHAEFSDPPEGISFLKEQQWRIQLRTAPVSRLDLTERVSLPATLLPAPGSKASVHSPVLGRLSELTTHLGSKVKAGDLLGTLEPSFNEFTSKLVEAEAEAIRAQAGLDQAQRIFERTKKLHAQQAKSDRELQDAEVALRSAQASAVAATSVQKLYQAIGAQFENGAVRLAVKSPIDGIVDKIFAGAGERVTPDDPIFTVINPSVIHVQAQVPETRLQEINSQLPALLQLGSDRSASPLTELKFISLSRELDPVTRTASLTYLLSNISHSFPLGALATLSAGARSVTNTLALPSSAIVEEDGFPIAFVQLSGETFEKRDLQIGVRDGFWTEITSGINEGERIVKDGAYPLLLSTKSGTIPAHGHAH